jgi:hypothetical protein
MQKQSLYRIAAVSLILLAATLSGHAQSRTDELAVSIPFDFNIGEKKLPAGDYIISRNFKMPNLLIVQRADRSATVIVQTLPLITTPQQMKTCLIFNEYRGQRFLARVQSRSGAFNHELIKTKGERQLTRIVEARNL